MADSNTKRKSTSLLEKQARVGYILALPIIIGLFLIYIPVLIKSVIFSFNDIKITAQGYTMTFIGFKHYIKAFTLDPYFMMVGTSSIQNMLIDLLFIIIFSFFVANVLNQKFRGRTFARIIFFLPVILATGIISKVEAKDLLLSMFQSGANMVDTGAISALNLTDLKTILRQSTLHPDMINLIIDAVDRMYDIVVASGVQILIFLAGLQSVPAALYEASYVEGCTGWESFWKITLPMISPLILVNTLYTIITSFTDPNNPTMEHIVNTSIIGTNYSYSAAMSWVYFGVIGIILAVIVGVINKVVYYQD